MTKVLFKSYSHLTFSNVVLTHAHSVFYEYLYRRMSSNIHFVRLRKGVNSWIPCVQDV